MVNNERRLAEGPIKPYWWCIKEECKHYCKWGGSFGSRNAVDNNCIHPSVVTQIPSNELSVAGFPIKQMPMCPVLYSVNLYV